jgi:hypothetical protein
VCPPVGKLHAFAWTAEDCSARIIRGRCSYDIRRTPSQDVAELAQRWSRQPAVSRRRSAVPAVLNGWLPKTRLFAFNSPVGLDAGLNVANAQQIEQRLTNQARLSGDQIHSDFGDKHILPRTLRAAPIAQIILKGASAGQQSRKACFHARGRLRKKNIAHSPTRVVVVLDPANYWWHPVRQAIPKIALQMVGGPVKRFDKLFGLGKDSCQSKMDGNAIVSRIEPGL